MIDIRRPAAYVESSTLSAHRSAPVPYNDVPIPVDPVIEFFKKDLDMTLLRENLCLTVEERLHKLQRRVQAADALRGLEAAKSCAVLLDGYSHFTAAFWHPFGPHGHESPDSILRGKRTEIVERGWTLWSFQFRHTLDAWFAEIRRTKPSSVYVFCSASRASSVRDPRAAPADAKRFRRIGDSKWEPVPTAIRVPHPFTKGGLASAFIVESICELPALYTLPPIEWYSQGAWRTDELPTRGEYLIRRTRAELGNRDSKARARRSRIVLELREPYLAVVNRD